jgi:predicted DNA-binding transcriptional regulator AlpA
MCRLVGVESQPAVVAMAELIDMLGLSKARVVQLIAAPGFPEPLAVIKAGKVWSYEDVKTWAESGGRTVRPIPPR